MAEEMRDCYTPWFVKEWRQKAILAKQEAERKPVELWDIVFQACDLIETLIAKNKKLRGTQIQGYLRAKKETQNEDSS